MTGALLQLDDVAGRRRVDDVADVVIIGSGAAGATAARVLSAAGVDVVMVEEGPRIPTTEARADLFSGLARGWRDAGTQMAQGRTFMPILQGRCVGGTTAINGAIIHRLPEPIRERWVREHGAGELLTAAALERVFDTMDDELHVAPPPPAIRGRNNELMAEAADRLGIESNAIRRNVLDCQGAARCLQGCPTGRRQSMDISYVPRSIAAGARVYATCRVARIDRRRGRATGVRGRFVDPQTGRRGPALTVRARHAVLCAASAIQTPVLLAAHGIGKRSRRVGRRLQGHPGCAVVGVFDEPVNLWFGATQGHESVHYWDERMKFESLALPPELAAVRIPALGPDLVRRLADFGHFAMWGVQVRARAHGRVFRGPGGSALIRYDLTDDDVRVIKLGLERLSEMMFAAGAREVLPGVHGLPPAVTSQDAFRKIADIPDDPSRFHFIMAHLFGTATMGTDPASSVVAPDGQAHDLPGLYVVDSSIFPTNMGVNPQHTIGAVAWLIAERLADRIS